jgi:hypothetical protein
MLQLTDRKMYFTSLALEGLGEAAAFFLPQRLKKTGEIFLYLRKIQ